MSKTLPLSKVFAEIKRSFRLALPLIASEVIHALSCFFATVMISHLSKETLAAHSLVWNISLSCIVFFIGLLFSISIMVSQSFGAKDNHSIKVCFTQGLLLALISVPIMMLIIWYSPVVLVWVNQDPAIIKLAKPAFHALAFTTPPFILMVVVQQFLIGINKPHLVTVMSILTVPITVFFFYVFLFGKLGFPNLGLSSIGYGLTASYCLVTTPVLLYLVFAKQFKVYRLFDRWWHDLKDNLKILFELIRLGIPLGALFFIEVALFTCVALMMGKLGTDTLAAYQIAHQYFLIALVVSFGLTQSTTVRVGMEVGKNDRKSLRLAARINMFIGLGFMSGFSLFYIYWPELAIGVDIDVKASHSRDLVNEASSFLAVVGIVIFVDCIRLIITGALRGLKDTKVPMVVSVIGSWGIAIPAAYLLGFKFGFGGVGILWGAVIGISLSAAVLFFRFNRLSKSVNLKDLVTKAK